MSLPTSPVHISTGYARNGSVIVIDGDNNISVNGGAGNDTINNYESNFVTIDGDTGDDSINTSGYVDYDGNYTIRGTDILINGGDGDNGIINTGSNVTIIAGKGNDTIINTTSSTLADDGTTYIETNHSDNVTINGGTDDDSINTFSDGMHTYVYNEGNGHDTISSSTSDYNADVITTWNYSNNFSLQINSSVGWSQVVSSNNIVLTVGDGSITLVDAATLSSGVNIGGVTYPIDTTTTTPADTSTATTPADTLFSNRPSAHH